MAFWIYSTCKHTKAYAKKQPLIGVLPGLALGKGLIGTVLEVAQAKQYLLLWQVLLVANYFQL